MLSRRDQEKYIKNSVASSIGFFSSFLYSWAMFPIEREHASWGGSKAAFPSAQQHFVLPALNSPATIASLKASKSQTSMPLYTETNISPRGTKSMYIDFYAPFKFKKKSLCQKKELLIKRILAVWLCILFFKKSWMRWEIYQELSVHSRAEQPTTNVPSLSTQLIS